LRVDPKDPKIQVIAICHTRELANQIADIYKALTKYSDITVENAVESGKTNANIVIVTLGKLKAMTEGRSKADLSSLKVVVVDEVDVFFSDPRNKDQILEFHKKIADRIKNKSIQYVLFSATYPDQVFKDIGELVDEA
jgi:ATP-dependent RNA helicase DeaD